MSLSIEFTGAADGSESGFDIGSAAGWSAFSRWVEKLPDDYALLKALAVDGSAENTELLSAELKVAVRAHRPPAKIKGVVRLLSDAIGLGEPGETATITM